jgi:two-component system CheB/CheR fusion protein
MKDLSMPSEIAARVEDAHAAKRRETSSQDELIARAAHELRGPLGSIANWVHLLSQAKQDTALQQQGLAAIQRALQLSGRLIDELSDVALLRAGRVRLRSGLVDLVAIVEMAIDKPRSTAREQGVSLELTRELASVPVLGDPDRLQQIVLHLVGNAVKFTPAGGRVDVTIDRDGTSWRLAVSDSGPGLAPELLPRLFGDLHSVDFATPRAPASLGVGLAIVHHLAELHGGSVEAASPGPGRGARFTVRLPVPALVPSNLGDASSSRADADPLAGGSRATGKRRATQQPPRLLPRA